MRSSATSCVIFAIACSGLVWAQGQAPARGTVEQGQGRGQRGGGRGPDWHPLPPLPLEAGATPSDVTRALTAAPTNLAADATVIKWKPDFSYDVLRKGLNRLVCYDLSGRPTHPAFESECTSIGNVPRVAQNLKFEASEQRQAMLEAAEKDGTRARPEFGSVWYHLMGPTRWGAHAHMTIAVPGATTQTLALPDNGKSGGIWIMNAGTTTAHLMIPNEAPSPLSGGGGPGVSQLPLEPGAVQTEVNRIVLAAPANLAPEATVIQWKPDFTYATLRKGKNNLVCYDLADRPSHPAFASECTTVGNLPRVAESLKIETASAAERTVKPEFGSITYDLTGPHRWDARLHLTIAMPDATARSTGFPENGSRGGAWIMNAGTINAHLMTPDDPPSVSMLR